MDRSPSDGAVLVFGLRSRGARTLVALVTLVGAALRLADLGGKSFWLDEAFSVALARTAWPAFARVVRTSEANMGLYYLMLRGWMHLGESEATIRLLSAFAGIATIPTVYVLGRRLFDRRAGLIGALVLALDPLHLALSQDARSYPLAILLVACSTLAFTHLVGNSTPRRTEAYGSEAPPHADGGTGWSIAYVIGSAAAVYAHFYAALVLVAQYGSLVRRRTGTVPARRLIACAIGIGGLVMPLVVFVVGGQHANLAWLRGEIPYVLTHLGQWVRAPIAIVAVPYVVLLVALAWGAMRAARRGGGWSYWLIGLWFAAPVTIPLVVSALFRPVFEFRYAAVAIPAVALAAGAVLAQVRGRRPAMLALLCVVLLEGTGDWIYFARVQKEDWRDATRAVLAAARPGDVAIFYAPYVRRPFDYYVRRIDRGVAPRVLYPPASYAAFGLTEPGDLTLPEAIAEATTVGARTWLVVGHARTDSTCVRTVDRALRATHATTDTWRYPGVEVRLYSEGTVARPAASGPVWTAAAIVQQCTQR